MNPQIEVKQEEVIAAAAALGALLGGLGGLIGWEHTDIQTGEQVSAKIAWVYANCPDSPERADLLTKLGQLLALLEGTG